jgi:hypothetical protein
MHHVPLKHQLIFTGLDISKKTEFFRKLYVGLEVLTVVIMKIMIWVVIPYSSACFGGVYHMYFLGPRVSPARSRQACM